MGTEIANKLTIAEMDTYARAIVASGFCGFKKPEEVVTLALIAQDEGRSIGSVARDYHIVQGRPSLKADAMLARYQTAGGKVKWVTLTDAACEAEFSHPASGTFTLSWTIEQAKKAGLTNTPTWSKYPRAMLRARVVSEGIRTSYPAVLCGTYTPEECEDMAAEEKAERAQSKREPEQVKPAPKPAVKAAGPIEAEIVKQEPAQSKAAEVTPEQATANFLEVVSKICKKGAPFASQALTAMGVGDLQAIPAGDRHALVNDLKKRIADLQARQKEIEDVPF